MEGKIAIDDCIATKEPPLGLSLKGREMKRHFHGDEGGRVVQLLHQAVKQLLTDPLFRRQAHPFTSPIAEDLLLIIIYARAQGC